MSKEPLKNSSPCHGELCNVIPSSARLGRRVGRVEGRTMIRAELSHSDRAQCDNSSIVQRFPKGVRTLGVITARGESRGIPKKNIVPLLGKPLIAYTIEATKGSKLLTHCIVSTNSKEIAEIARGLGAEVPFLRPEELATEEASSIAVMQHALKFLKEHKGEEYDYAMILQPTSPLRTAEDIDATIQKAVETGADSVMSMVEVQDFAIEKLKWLDGDRIRPLLEEEGKHSKRRDETPNAFRRNTAIYLTKVDCIMNGDLFGDDSRAYVMPIERSVDINEISDIKLAEFWMRTLHLHGA